MPKLPSPRPDSTSSLVPPNAAISKSWIAAAPFIATWVTIPRSIHRSTRGPSPTLITCPPSRSTTALRRPAPPVVRLPRGRRRPALPPPGGGGGGADPPRGPGGGGRVGGAVVLLLGG